MFFVFLSLEIVFKSWCVMFGFIIRCCVNVIVSEEVTLKLRVKGGETVIGKGY